MRKTRILQNIDKSENYDKNDNIENNKILLKIIVKKVLKWPPIGACGPRSSTIHVYFESVL